MWGQGGFYNLGQAKHISEIFYNSLLQWPLQQIKHQTLDELDYPLLSERKRQKGDLQYVR
jgi:hypothetical protein